MSWKERRLGDVLTLKRGYDLPEAQRRPGDVPVISSSGITGSHNIAMVAGPGVVTGRYGTMGEVFYVEGDYWPHNTALYVRDFKGNNPRFIAYFLKNALRGTNSNKAAVPGVNRNDLHERKVCSPDLETQGRIVEQLLPIDDLIENNRRRIKLLEDAARLLYREWFVHLRFPGHEHVKVVDGVPEGWSRISLGELLTLQRGFDLPASARVEGGYPVYAATGIHGRHNKAMVKGPGVITGRSGSLGKVLYSPDDFWPLNTTLWVKDFKLVSPEFAFFLLSGLNLEQFNGGAAVPTLNRNDVHRIEVRLPPQRLIEEFSEIVLVQLRQIEGLIRFNAKLCEARDLLLPRLMSGELAV